MGGNEVNRIQAEWFPWWVLRHNKGLAGFRTRNEALQEASWRVLGEDFYMTADDEYRAILDLQNQYEVLGYRVTYIPRQVFGPATSVPRRVEPRSLRNTEGDER